MPGSVVVLRGASMSGKSVAGRRLSTAFPKGACVSVDGILEFFVEGRTKPSNIQLGLANAAAVVDSLASAGFDVVVEWLFSEPELLDFFLTRMKSRTVKVHLVTLLVSSEAHRQRRSALPPDAVEHFKRPRSTTVMGLDREKRGARIDTSALTVEEVCAAAAEIVDSRRAIVEVAVRQAAPPEGNSVQP